ncbi:SCO family protein [Asticcacaulis sp. AND118]|uniref:SCO family protein n=1 Tax=Asticcacaulis sp. AND118 TaxID=2840468 RepID=UPI001D0015B6|nr:SCO family protein [Asticcacaulis sp. AND118]UDF03618.1 SCO family protein [Asticcacaulis sp. AND118]
MNRTRLTIIAVLVIGLGALVVGMWGTLLGQKPVTSRAIDSAVRIGGPFALTDQYGQPQTQEILKGKWTAVFFGFTYCPDICPLTLQSLDQTRQKLGKDANKLQFVFITVDPERDTPEAMKAYLESGGFPKGVIGLTGTPEQVSAAARTYRATYEKVGEGADYTMNHTSVVYLMNPRGEFAAPLTHGLPPEKAADVIRQAMKEF